LWLLPAVFVIHDGEEMLTMAPWVEGHRGVLAAMAQHGRLVAKLLASVPRTQAHVTIGVVLLLLPFLLITAAVARQPRPGPWLTTYVMLLGGFFLHAFGHLGQALLFGGYVPGLVGALLAVVPGSLYVYRRLIAAGLLRPREAAAQAFVGLAALAVGGLALIRLASLLAALAQ
jgi:hypothetical protein